MISEKIFLIAIGGKYSPRGQFGGQGHPWQDLHRKPVTMIYHYILSIEAVGLMVLHFLPTNFSYYKSMEVIDPWGVAS